MISEEKKIQHLYSRAASGLSAEDFGGIQGKSLVKAVDVLFDNSKKVNTINLTKEDITDREYFKKASKERRKELRRLARKRIKNINYECLRRLAFESEALREKMTIFWHNHFSSFSIFPGWVLKQNNFIREHALGNFGDMLMGITKDPMMIFYLNNQQNKKGHPNENFAREVMELFTLGRDNGYTERDIQEAARAFTGMAANLKGEYIFREGNHDGGEKTVFGKKGKFRGEDIIRMLLENKQTAKYITGKVYKYFVNDQLDEKRVNELSKLFYKSNYNIETLLRAIFSSDWFYEEENIGNKIKSPIELLSGLMKSFRMEFQDANSLVEVQKIMGQVLFFPPNVAGWPGGLNWIDSSSLMFRMRMAEFIFNNAEIDFEPKEDLGMEMEEVSMQIGKRKKKNKEKIQVTTDLSEFINHFMKYEEKELFDKLKAYLFSGEANSLDKAIIEKHAKRGSKLEYLTSMTVLMLSSPQYQLC